MWWGLKHVGCFSVGSCWEIIIIKQIHTFTSNILFERRRFGLGCTSLYQVKPVFDLIKAGATQTETPSFKQFDAGERVDLLDDVVCWHSLASTVVNSGRTGFCENCSLTNPSLSSLSFLRHTLSFSFSLSLSLALLCSISSSLFHRKGFGQWVSLLLDLRSHDTQTVQDIIDHFNNYCLGT